MTLGMQALQSLHAGLANWIADAAIPRASLHRVEAMVADLAARRQPWKHTDQRPIFYMPELRAQAWWDPAEFPWTAMLAQHADAIVGECRRLREGTQLKTHPEPLVSAGHWEILPLFSFGKRHEENLGALPQTARLLEKIPTAANAGLVYLSSLVPDTAVRPHFGPTNCRLRCHFGVTVPPHAMIRVGRERRTWTEGKCIVFDDSFEHEVANPGTQRRDVLIIDFWHPGLSPDECRALQFLTQWLREHNHIPER
ncbi:MAG: aspartyl/asparaginyl beta-hydroxylase domain-containing protein [Pseudomonadota bacterium]